MKGPKTSGEIEPLAQTEAQRGACVGCGARAAWCYTGEDHVEDWLCWLCAEHWLAELVLMPAGDHVITLRVIGNRLLLVSDEDVTEEE